MWAAAVHGGTALGVCRLPRQHAQDLGISMQEIIPVDRGVPCLKAVGLWAVCQQHWNHATEAEVHGNSGKALHYVESEVESSLQGRWAVSAVQVMWSQISVRLAWRILSMSVINLVSLVSYLSWWERRTSLVSFQAWSASALSCHQILSHPSTLGLSTFRMGLMRSSLGHDLLCCLEGGEALELLGQFRAEFLALCDQLVDLCHLVPA